MFATVHHPRSQVRDVMEYAPCYYVPSFGSEDFRFRTRPHWPGWHMRLFTDGHFHEWETLYRKYDRPTAGPAGSLIDQLDIPTFDEAVRRADATSRDATTTLRLACAACYPAGVAGDQDDLDALAVLAR